MADYTDVELFVLTTLEVPGPEMAPYDFVDVELHTGLGAAAPDTTPPTLALVSPADGRLERDLPLVFDLLDDGDVTPIIGVYWPGFDLTELVWSGAAFESRYSASTRTAVSGGFRYALRRTGGWPVGGVRLRVHAVDRGGNVGVLA